MVSITSPELPLIITHFEGAPSTIAISSGVNLYVYNVADDVFRRVIDAARFADFGLLFNARALVGCNDDLTEKAFVDTAENVTGDGVEIVRRLAMGKAFTDLIEDPFVGFELVAIKQSMLFENNSV